MSAKKTVDLVKLVEKRAGDPNSSVEAQQLINQGADIKAPTKNGSMIDSVTSEARRHQQTFPEKAKECQKLIQVLKNHASDLFATSVLSSDGGNLAELSQLIRLHANCYQSEKFGPLGLLGELFKREKTPIRLDIVKFLVETDPALKFALMRINDQRQTCLSLLSNNPKCPPDVKQFIQNTINMILNQVPYTHPQFDVNEIAEWIHRGANPEAVDNQGNTVLLNAVLSNNQILVDKLLAVGCNAEHVNNNKHTALQIAQNATPRNAQLEALLKVQSINSELQRLIETQKSLLTFEEVHAVLEKGAKINALIPNKCTPLHLLIANEGTPEMIAAFINDFNADISAMDINGYRPIEVCILFDKDPFLILQTYLQLPKVSTETYFNPRLNKSIVQFAIEQRRPEAAKIIQDILNLRLWNTMIHANKREENNRNLIPELNLLIKYDAELDHQHTDEDYEKWTILHLACKITTNIFVQYLIEQLKVNHTLLNGNGDSPLSIAAEYGDLLIVKYLHGVLNAPLNCSNNDKQTPLHLATKNHHLLVVRYLVQWGADHQAENVSKQTPLDIARANKSNNKNDELTDKRLIHFLEQLICPAIDPTDQEQNLSTKPTSDLDICESIKPFIVEPIKATTLGDEERLGQQKKGFLFGNVNDSLLNAAKDGSLTGAKTAIGEGANICYRKNNRNAYEIATQSAIEYQNQSKASPTNTLDHQQYVNKMKFCQQIAELLRHTAYERMIQAMQESDAYRVVAYHQAGAPLAVDLLNFICKKSDNVQIVDYLIQQSAELFQAMFNYSTTESPYQIAKNHKFNNVASYLKYRLSLECTKAIQANDIEGVKKLIRAGARVEMHDTNNLQVAIYKHRNVDMVRLLCENGAKMPIEWLQSKQISLPTEIAKTIDSNIVFRINRSLLNRRLRLAAACGDLPLLTRCQHYGADINSINCHGSTALLCSIQYGNYFPIVHALVSRGATMLHNNKHELMSLIALAKNKNYKQITDYLSQTLNAQFIVTILNNDIKNAERFEALGVDFNFKDEEERTALHYAVQYHGIELVSWLCDRGTSPTIADVNGNYPMTEAAEKGILNILNLN
jgi:ankyrin repeat protein